MHLSNRELDIELVKADAGWAEEALIHNVINRPVRKSRVDTYAKAMEQGDWGPCEAAICFDTNDNLINGQHRLMAQVQSQTTQLWIVMRNMSPESFLTMDSGANRSTTDALQLRGESNAAMLAATARLCMMSRTDAITKNKTPQFTSPEIVAFIDSNPEIHDSVAVGLRYRTQIEAAPRVIAVAHWLIVQRSGVRLADWFIRRLARRTNEGENSPILTLDSRLRQIRRKNERVTSGVMLTLFIKTWNGLVTDSPVRLVTKAPKGAEIKFPVAKAWTGPYPTDLAEDPDDTGA
jgi:hypothetical protein